MRLGVICVLVMLVVGAHTRPINRGLEALKYLRTYGFLKKASPSIEDVAKAIRHFQRFNSLEVTGGVDDATAELMGAPRCGDKDVESTEEDEDAPETFTAYRAWNKAELTYKQLNYPTNTNLRRKKIRSIVDASFQKWENAVESGLSVYAAGKREPYDLEIRFDSYDHGDSYPFDGPGIVLAHAFMPSNGRIHFDDSERWIGGYDNGFNLEWVAVHEFGHALGLKHTNVSEAVMYPYYKRTGSNDLHSDDVAGINALYP